MHRERAQLLVVDLQERLLPAIPAGGAALARATVLVRAAARLSIPIAASEHYPRGIGATVPALRGLLTEHGRIFEKITFSAASDPAIAQWLADNRADGRDQVVLCGTEAHVCVLQTALELIEHGYTVFVAGDAVASRAESDRQAATARLLHAGGHWVTTEMGAFEWLGRGDDPAFKDVLALIK